MINRSDEWRAKRLRAALRKRGWSQVELARRLQLSEAAVSLWMTGRQQPRPATAVRLARMLGISLDQVYRPAPPRVQHNIQ